MPKFDNRCTDLCPSGLSTLLGVCQLQLQHLAYFAAATADSLLCTFNTKKNYKPITLSVRSRDAIRLSHCRRQTT